MTTKTTHYHVISGDHGYMPDSNTVHESQDDARTTFEWFVDRVMDDCVYAGHDGAKGDDNQCVTYSRDLTYATISPARYHGVEYAEVTDCNDDCELDN